MAVVSAFMISIVAALAVDELRAWLPRITKRVTAIAIARLPNNERERYAEEWQSDINQIPSDVSRFIYTIGLVVAARRMTRCLKGRDQSSRYGDAFRRVLDLCVSLLAIVIGYPVFGVLFIAIRINNSSGPTLYLSRYLGKSGSEFTLMKFCTQFNMWSDGRMSEIDRVLRRYSLDGLPQIFNLLRGEITLVGPRPVRPADAEQIAKSVPGYLDRLRVKPGLTGLAQIYFYGQPTICPQTEIILDREYIANRSLRLDLQILAKTVAVVLGISRPIR